MFCNRNFEKYTKTNNMWKYTTLNNNIIENFHFMTLPFLWIDITFSMERIQKIVHTETISFTQVLTYKLVIIAYRGGKLNNWRNVLCNNVSTLQAEQYVMNTVWKGLDKGTWCNKKILNAVLSIWQELWNSKIEV